MDTGEARGGAPPPAQARTETLAPAGATGRPAGAALPGGGRSGAALGRYVVLDLLGSGGMGEVYAAYDRRLDRKVALKLLRPDRTGDREAARLLREAQALARLAHPNVVTVHDVGVYDDGVFVAMEFVAGPTLRAWLERGPRPWRGVLEVFLAAGRGLAAVHEAGLVHRDFKPDNVMLLPDGRAVVMDFGLARPADAGGPQADRAGAAADLDAAGRALAAGLTETGTLLGTPGYMAPEQLRGEPADARSDQFSFSVALAEALASSARPGGARSPAPRWLRRAVAKGAAAAPADRHPSMAAYLALLARGMRARARRVAVAALALVVLVGSASFVQLERARRARCSGGEARLAQAWGPEPREAVRGAFLATGVPFAGAAWEAVARGLDRWGAGWVAARRSACEATHLQGEQSDRLLDLRMACYDRRLGEVDALIGVLASADPEVVETAQDALARLPGLARCADAEGLLGRQPPPAGEEARRRLAAAERGIAEVWALTDTGRYEQAVERGEAVMEETRALGYPPATAEAAYTLAAAHVELGDDEAAEPLLYEALSAGEQGGDDGLVGRVATELVYLLGYSENRFDEVDRWYGLARGALARVGDDPELEHRIHLYRGTALSAEGRYGEAVTELEAALAVAARSYGADSVEASDARNDLATVLGEAGRYDEAVENLERAVEIRTATLGREHPSVATSLDNLGVVLNNAGRHEEALALQEEALGIRSRTLPEGHARIAKSHANLAVTLFHLGRFEESLERDRIALEMRRAALGEDHFEVGVSYNNIASTYRTLGRFEESLENLEHARAIFEAALGPDHPIVAFALNNQGAALLALGRAAEAVPPLERALTLRRAGGVADKDLAVTLYNLAQALRAAGREPQRARALAEQALERYRRAGAGFVDDASEVEALLAAWSGAGRPAAPAEPSP